MRYYKTLVMVLCSALGLSCHQNLVFYALPEEEDETHFSSPRAGDFSLKSPAGDRFLSTRFDPEEAPSPKGIRKKGKEKHLKAPSRRQKKGLKTTFRGGKKSDRGASQSGQKTQPGFLAEKELSARDSSSAASEELKVVADDHSVPASSLSSSGLLAASGGGGGVAFTVPGGGLFQPAGSAGWGFPGRGVFCCCGGLNPQQGGLFLRTKGRQ